MVDQEQYEQRMQRLRSATDSIELPPGLVSRVLASVEQRSNEPSLWELLWTVGRWALVPATCAPAALGAALLLAGNWLDEAIYVASSVGWIP